MRLLNLSEVEQGVAQSKVGEIVFHGRADIFSALYVISVCFLYKECVGTEIDVRFQGGRSYRNILIGLEGVG